TIVETPGKASCRLWPLVLRKCTLCDHRAADRSYASTLRIQGREGQASKHLRRLGRCHRMPDEAGSLSQADLKMTSVEGRASWVAAGVTLAILSIAYGSTLLIVVGLRVMELDIG